jgi:hypothetical protein
MENLQQQLKEASKEELVNMIQQLMIGVHLDSDDQEEPETETDDIKVILPKAPKTKTDKAKEEPTKKTKVGAKRKECKLTTEELRDYYEKRKQNARIYAQRYYERHADEVKENALKRYYAKKEQKKAEGKKNQGKKV